MRGHGFTTRGQCFLAAAAAAAVCAILLGERDLLRVAVLLAALPVISVLAVSRTHFLLACTRSVRPGRIQVGQSAEVTVRVENLSQLPIGLILLEETVPPSLGGPVRFVVDRLAGRQFRSATYRVRPDHRGRYQLGPLTVRFTDPLGLCELVRSFAGTDDLVVIPTVAALPTVRIPGYQSGSGESRTRTTALRGEDDAATREYRHGDDLRKVHWRSTARVGELMVRREEQPHHNTAAVLLDNRIDAHGAEKGPSTSFEWAVNAAASMAVHLAASDFTVRLVTASGTDISAGQRGSEGLILDLLAEITPARQARLEATVQNLHHSPDGLTVAILGAVDPTDLILLRRLARDSTAVAVLIDTSGWRTPPGRATSGTRSSHDVRYEQTARDLQAAGWRVLCVRHGAQLAELWPLVAERGNVDDFLLAADGLTGNRLGSVPSGDVGAAWARPNPVDVVRRGTTEGS